MLNSVTRVKYNPTRTRKFYLKSSLNLPEPINEIVRELVNRPKSNIPQLRLV